MSNEQKATASATEQKTAAPAVVVGMPKAKAERISDRLIAFPTSGKGIGASFSRWICEAVATSSKGHTFIRERDGAEPVIQYRLCNVKGEYLGAPGTFSDIGSCVVLVEGEERVSGNTKVVEPKAGAVLTPASTLAAYGDTHKVNMIGTATGDDAAKAYVQDLRDELAVLGVQWIRETGFKFANKGAVADDLAKQRERLAAMGVTLPSLT